MEASTHRPRLALSLGDPAGIGPELALALHADPDVRAAARLLLIGPESLRPANVPLESSVPADVDVAWLDVAGPRSWDMGRVQPACGRMALDALRAGHELALSGAVDALVTGPVSKEAMHAAGEPCEGQSELLGRWSGASNFEMVAVAGPLRVMLLSRHMPLREALELVRRERVLAKLALFDATLRGWGIAQPRLALAGLNPHAGEAGLLGSEEAAELVPAVEAARAQGLDVKGPVSPDSVFGAALRGKFDGVLALYHDQAFIPVKLLAPDSGLTVLAGLPYLRISPAHGTAFDIAGKGLASPRNLKAALLQAAAWCPAR